jgi:hypothetical protein
MDLNDEVPEGLTPDPEAASTVLTAGLTSTTWIRNARTGGDRSPAKTFAGVLALAGELGPVTVGGSFYRGRAGQGEPGIEADITLAELHARAAWKGLEAKAIYAVGAMTDAELVAPGEVIGSRVRGGYLEVAYDVLGWLTPGSDAALLPFVRYEAMDLNDEVPEGLTPDPEAASTVLTAGLTFRPLPTVVFKADWQRRENDVPGAGPVEQLNLGAGFAF